MPTVAVSRDELYERIGLSLSYTVDEFERLCFEFGVELDEVMDEAQAAEKRQREEAISDDSAPSSSNSSSSSSSSSGSTVAAASASKGGPKPSGRLLYYIATPANRPDLLCIEGIARGFNIFLGRIPVPVRLIEMGGGAH
jgi:phenylalanyl-tRNA synthetase beta chain